MVKELKPETYSGYDIKFVEYGKGDITATIFKHNKEMRETVGGTKYEALEAAKHIINLISGEGTITLYPYEKVLTPNGMWNNGMYRRSRHEAYIPAKLIKDSVITTIDIPITYDQATNRSKEGMTAKKIVFPNGEKMIVDEDALWME